MAVKLNSAGGGSVTLDVPSTAGLYTQLHPAVSGTLITTGDSQTVTPTMLTQKLTQGTALATTSGTSFTFTGIPSWAKRVTVMFNNVSTATGSNIQIQIGSGSVTTTGYASSSVAANGAIVNVSTGFIQTQVNVTTNNYSGQSTICLLSGNLYLATGNMVSTNSTNNGMNNAGTVTLSGAMDRVVVTTVTGTDVFDAGSINIMYEG